MRRFLWLLLFIALPAQAQWRLGQTNKLYYHGEQTVAVVESTTSDPVNGPAYMGVTCRELNDLEFFVIAPNAGFTTNFGQRQSRSVYIEEFAYDDQPPISRELNKSWGTGWDVLWHDVDGLIQEIMSMWYYSNKVEIRTYMPNLDRMGRWHFRVDDAGINAIKSVYSACNRSLFEAETEG